MRIRLIAISVALIAAAALVSCGSGSNDESPASGGAPLPGASAADTSSVDARRFVFGAEPGKPVVYWIHTDW